jgi:putative protease
MANRDGNRGFCAQPCRWQYALVEEKRPGHYFPINEDDRGTYIFNSRDLCMIAYIPQMIACGVNSLKIEGRMKSIHYLASTVKVYREAIDTYYRNPDNYPVRPEWLRELAGVNQRGYCTGFYLAKPDQINPDYEKMTPVPPHLFIGKVLSGLGAGKIRVDVRNKIQRDDIIEILSPTGPATRDRVIDLVDDSGNSVACAHPGSQVTLRVQQDFQAPALIRKITDP